ASCAGPPAPTDAEPELRQFRATATEEATMAGKSDFPAQEREDQRKRATGAGLLVSVSDRSFFDTFKEASALAKHVKGARDSDSQLVRELSAERGTGFGMISASE